MGVSPAMDRNGLTRWRSCATIRAVLLRAQLFIMLEFGCARKQFLNFA
jgi:hypothetical protein